MPVASESAEHVSRGGNRRPGILFHRGAVGCSLLQILPGILPCERAISGQPALSQDFAPKQIPDRDAA